MSLRNSRMHAAICPTARLNAGNARLLMFLTRFSDRWVYPEVGNQRVLEQCVWTDVGPRVGQAIGLDPFDLGIQDGQHRRS
jgi:hypothetical protein